ncbi:hypothetical protein ID866_4947 [Astraeus odoratus]|nr:hypothetical protein ID866_4947 [Astraeus odoratus]
MVTLGEHSTVHDNDAELLEREKRRNLSGAQHKTSSTIEDAPGWNEYLASASEAHVKVCCTRTPPVVMVDDVSDEDLQADRSNTSINDLQEKTVKHIYARHHPDDDRPGATGAMYVRDEVAGPLGSAQVGEFEVVVDSDRGDVDADGRTVARRVVREEKVEVKREPSPTESETYVLTLAHGAMKVRADQGIY